MSHDIFFTQVKDQATVIRTVRLAYEIWHQHYDLIIGSEQVDYMLEKYQSAVAISNDIENNGYDYYLLEQSGRAIGYYAVKADKTDNSLFLSKLYICKQARGQGLARKMLEHIQEKNKPDSIWLTVNRNNKNTIAVYKHLGFVIEKKQKVDIGSGYFMDDYVFRLNTAE